VKTDAKNPELHVTLGRLYAQKKDTAKAEASFKQAITIDEKHIGGTFNLARLYLASKKETEGVAQLQRILTEPSG
jgi:uncharacterized protein HemY